MPHFTKSKGGTFTTSSSHGTVIISLYFSDFIFNRVVKRLFFITE